MKKSLIPFALYFALLFSACNSGSQKTDAQNYADTAANPAKSIIAVLNSEDPVLIDSSENVMYPLVNKPAANNDSGGSFESRGGAKTYWNIIFYNTASKKYHLLDAVHKMIINSYNTSYANREYDYSDSYSSNVDTPSSLNVTKRGNYIFYSIVIDDFDRNGIIDSDDPDYLFISDKEGNNFRQISPDNRNVNSWELIEKSGKVLMQTVSDTNHDNKFSDEEVIVPYIYDLKKGGKTEPVFDTQFSKRVNDLHQKLWPVKNK
jgi:hypothetical protein